MNIFGKQSVVLRKPTESVASCSISFRTTAHEVLPYSGERYSNVFYTTEDYGLVDDRDSKDVASRGPPKPTLGNHAAPHQC